MLFLSPYFLLGPGGGLGLGYTHNNGEISLLLEAYPYDWRESYGKYTRGTILRGILQPTFNVRFVQLSLRLLLTHGRFEVRYLRDGTVRKSEFSDAATGVGAYTGLLLRLNDRWSMTIGLSYDYFSIRTVDQSGFRLYSGLRFDLPVSKDRGEKGVNGEDILISGGLMCATSLILISTLPANTRFFVFQCGGGQVGCGNTNVRVIPDCSGSGCSGGYSTGSACPGDCAGGSSGFNCSGGSCSGSSSSCSGGSSDCSGGSSSAGCSGSSSTMTCFTPSPYPINLIKGKRGLRYYVGKVER